MNKLSKFFLLIPVFFTQFFNAQVFDAASSSSVSKEKTNFIESQQYLKPSSTFKNYVQFYADSLQGFDEVSSTQLLLERRFYGAEFTHGMNQLKRQFINGKYKLGEFNPNNNSISSSAGYKPGGGNGINSAPCVNEGFEATAPGQYTTFNGIAGWTLANGSNGFPNGGACVTPTFGTNGSPECWVVTTPLADPYLGTLPASPLGGTNVLKMNNNSPGVLITQIRQTFPVTTANSLFQFAYAGAWDGSGHACCDQPFFKVDIYNCAGAPLPCSSISLTPSGSGCTSGVAGYSVTSSLISWTNWTVKYIDLTPYIGSCITVKVTNGDCNGGAHFGYAFFDAKCGGQLVGSGLGGNAGNIGGPVSFCAGSNAAGIVAPLGYASYQWAGPPGVTYTPALANAPSITVSPVVVGQVFTVTMVSASGCTFTAKDTIKYSSVYISAINTTSTCPGGASGAATVFASGSSSGITYTYTSITTPSLNLSSATGSIVTGLPPGTYSVVAQGGGGTCGTASYSFQIGISPPNFYSYPKPFCGNSAFLTTAGGSNFQWYNNTTPIPPPIGTASGLTVSPAFNNSIYILSYTTPQGCKDSIKYTLQAAVPGNVAVPNIGLICPGGTNGTASVVITPAANAPTGLNQYQVISTGTTPAYNSTLAPTSSNTFVPINLQAGTYSVIAFDGSCKYGTTFTVNPYTFSYTVTPTSGTVCQGGVLTASINFGLSITGTPCSTIGVGPPCANPAILQVGNQTGSNGTTTWPAPYGNWYKNARHQMLFRASELTAMGIGQGYITSLAFNVTTINGTTLYSGYTIKLKCTSVISLPSTFDNAGLSQVYSANYNVTTGWNTHSFTTPYYWDGVSNLLVDVCYNLSPNYTQNSISPFMTTPFTSCVLWYSDFSIACMTTQLPFQITSNRPIVRFGNCSAPNPNAFTYNWTPSTFLSTTTQSSTIVTPTTAPGTISQINYSVTLTPTVINCPVMNTFTAVVVNPVTPTITATSNMCNNALPVTITVTPTGGTFSTGIAGNPIGAASGIITPSLAAIGTNTFMYSVGVGSCTASNSGSFQVSQYNTAALTSSIAPMCVTSPVINLMGIVQNTVTGVWTGQNVSGTYSFTPAGLATNTYALIYNTVSTPNATVCPETSTMVVSVLNPPTPVITPIGPYCNTASNAQVVVNPTTGTWTPVSYQSAGGVFSPSLAAIGNNTVQYVIGTFTCNTQATSTINIEAFVPAVVTGSVPDQCNTNPVVNLTPLTTNNLGTWTGPGTSGFNFNPSTSGVGSLTLTYNTNSSPIGLCPDQATLSVKVFSLATPAITQVGPFCNMHGGIQIPVTPLGGIFSSFSANTINQQGLFLPTQAAIGANVVNYSVTSGPCVATAQTTIQVEAFVSADLSQYAGPYCRNNLPVNMNSIVQIQGGTWSGPGMTGSTFNPATANIGNTNILIYYTQSSPTASLCPDSSAIRIQVNDIPKVTIVSNTDRGCLPVVVTFNTPSTNTGVGEWNFGDGSPTATGLLTTHTYTTPGSYTVSIYYEDDIGCSTQTTLATPVNVYETPHADFSYNPEEVTMIDPVVQFNNLSTVLDHNSYQWQIGNMYQLNEVNPKVTFPQTGDYNIILTATTINGCTDVISRNISVKNDFGVYIPSSFSPNFDGLNDVFIPVFSPYGLDLKVYEMEIFDRWGHSLFKTKDFTVGWNGTARGSEEPIKEDVYVYKVKYKDAEGRIYHKTGHVTLLK
ncbi:MAG: gliding motility-associated C-terminal domain-containing protein [Bacteroidetes bacterium]|nr:gliding motility-associated C-terminal domain-containing protein [Bacteroidota bacterium]